MKRILQPNPNRHPLVLKSQDPGGVFALTSGEAGKGYYPIFLP
jgi:hypothetical protein